MLMVIIMSQRIIIRKKKIEGIGRMIPRGSFTGGNFNLQVIYFMNE